MKAREALVDGGLFERAVEDIDHLVLTGHDTFLWTFPAPSWRPAQLPQRGAAPGRRYVESKIAAYPLNRNSITSPSCTTYSFPSARARPCSRAGFQPPTRTKSSYETVSARIKPFS